MSLIEHIAVVICPPPIGEMFNHDAGGGVGTIITNPVANTFPPLSALYCCSVLRKFGIQVTFIDANVEQITFEDITTRIKESLTSRYSAILLFGSLVSLPIDIELIKLLRIVFNKIPCGYASTVAHLFLKELYSVGASPILSGDIEASLVKAINDFNYPTKYERCFLTEEEMNNHLYPSWDLADMSKYSSYVVLSSRGCNFGCPHCPYYVYQRSTFTARSVASTVSEIKWLSDVYHLDYFLFRDPCFSYDMKRSKSIAEGIAGIKAQTRLAWGCETRPECLDRELISTFAAAGCHHIRMGIESLDSSIIGSSRNLFTDISANEYINHVKNVIEWCRIYKIYSVCFLMVGFPSDSKSTIRRSCDFIDAADPDIALVNYIVPYPSTLYAIGLSDKGIKLSSEWSTYGSKNVPVLPTNHLNLNELKTEKEQLESYFIKRNRQFYPIR